jgi:threonine aldolase
MMFRSDNVAAASPEMLQAIERANHGEAPSYGTDSLTQGLHQVFSDLFERRVWCFPAGTGIAANGLALAAIAPPETIIACHQNAHIRRSEDGAVAFFTEGAELAPLSGGSGKIAPDALDSFARRGYAAGKPWAALSIAQLTEAGTLYENNQIAELAEIAHSRGARVHMDGARFANAIAAFRCTAAEASWRCGVDVLSFGATKNGAMSAEAIVVFDEKTAQVLAEKLKRTGQLNSKMRYLAAQLHAYLQHDLWLGNARHANAMAARLAAGIQVASGACLAHPVNGNLIFVRLAPEILQRLSQAGIEVWQNGTDDTGQQTYRLATSFQTTIEEVNLFLSLLEAPVRLLGASGAEGSSVT